MNKKKSPRFILSLDRTSRVQQFNDWIVSQVRAGQSNLLVDVQPSRTYSNVCAPIAGVIDYYRSKGIKINIHCKKGDYSFHTRFWNPVPIEKCKDSEEFYPFDKVWTFSTSEGVSKLVSAFILALRKDDIIKEGVVESVDWCLNEVMDNVLQHSKTNIGYVMAQVHKQSKVFAFCVFDSGIGFYKSLKDSKHHPEKPIDAITLALQEKVTRDEQIGQGNGLWGLSSIVSKSQGQIEISSGGATYKFINGQVKTIKEGGFVLDKDKGTAYLDVRLNYNKELNILDALTDKNGIQYSPVDLWLENLEDDKNQYQIVISEQSGGTGTRKSAEKLRNMILNISNNEKKVVVLDFKGINLVSSSFADELIGKIIAEKGFLFFTKAFRIINMSDVNAQILNRSVGQRMAQVYLTDALRNIAINTQSSTIEIHTIKAKRKAAPPVEVIPDDQL